MRRLSSDAEGMRLEFAGHPYIMTMPLDFEPADRYRVAYSLNGVTLDQSGQPVIAQHHSVMITLGAGYPREKPMVNMETAIFHPNIRQGIGGEVCIGDYWSPAQSLADIVVMIGEMIQYQRYNVRSPLNGIAAEWVALHEDIFPVGDADLYLHEADDIVLGAPIADVGT
ncbi:MAG: ubiquitin-conjugating enzyme E2 [Acidimicrobiales bacterium]